MEVLGGRLPGSLKNPGPPMYFPHSVVFSLQIEYQALKISVIGAKLLSHHICYLKVNIVNKVISINSVK